MRESADFRLVKDQGRSLAAAEFVLAYLFVAPDQGPRIGVIASRRVGGAVQRNRVRRRLRHLAANQLEELRCDVWLVLVARGACIDCSQSQLENSWVRLARKAGILHPA